MHINGMRVSPNHTFQFWRGMASLRFHSLSPVSAYLTAYLTRRPQLVAQCHGSVTKFDPRMTTVLTGELSDICMLPSKCDTLCIHALCVFTYRLSLLCSAAYVSSTSLHEMCVHTHVVWIVCCVSIVVCVGCLGICTCVSKNTLVFVFPPKIGTRNFVAFCLWCVVHKVVIGHKPPMLVVAPLPLTTPLVLGWCAVLCVCVGCLGICTCVSKNTLVFVFPQKIGTRNFVAFCLWCVVSVLLPILPCTGCHFTGCHCPPLLAFC